MPILELAITFFVIAIILWIVGARGIAGITMEIARLLVIVFVILAVISIVLN